MIQVNHLVVPIPVIVKYTKEKKFREYPETRSQLMDENRNPIKVYWNVEKTENCTTITYNNITYTFGELFQKFISKGENEFPYRLVLMEIYGGNETGGRWLSFTFEAVNKNVFDNIYFAIRDWLCKVFECEPFIF